MTESIQQDLQQSLLKHAEEILGALASAAKSAQALAVEQLPELAQQYILYGRFVSTIAVVAGLIGIVLCANWLFRWALLNTCNWPDDDGDPSAKRFLYGILGVIAGFVGSVLFGTYIKSFGLVWFAPKVWLLLELVTLVKS